MTDSPLILVVEDNLANQLLACIVLEREGYRVDVANTSAEALERLDACTPDLILMDVQLPGQGGLDLACQLKADPATAAIPIVAHTAHAMAGDKEAALAAGCEGYIAKPIDTRTFAGQVARFLSPGRRQLA